MPNKDTTPLSLYGNDREYLREQERTNELLADIAGETYDSPGDIPKGKYIVQKRMLDAAQKKNELLESIAGGGGGGGAAKGIDIDYGTDVISLTNKDGDTIQGSGATLPAYGVSFDPTTGGLTLTKNGTAMQGQTVTIPNYGSPVGVTSSSDMTDHDTIYLYEGTTGGGYTQGHFYYWDGTAWADGGEYAAATVQTDKTLLVEDRAADAKTTGEAVSELKESINQICDGIDLNYTVANSGTHKIYFAIIKGWNYTVTNNTDKNCTVNIVRTDGTAKSISNGLVPNKSISFIADEDDYIGISCWCGGTGEINVKCDKSLSYFRNLELNLANLNGLIYTANSTEMEYTVNNSTGGIVYTIYAKGFVVRLATSTSIISQNIYFDDVDEEISDYIAINEDNVVITIPSYSRSLTYNTVDGLLHLRNLTADGWQDPNDITLIVNAYAAPVGGVFFREYIYRQVLKNKSDIVSANNSISALSSTIATNKEEIEAEIDKDFKELIYGTNETFTISNAGTHSFYFSVINGKSYTFTNNTNATCTLHLLREDGTAKNISNGVTSGNSKTFTADENDYVGIRMYVNGTGTVKVVGDFSLKGLSEAPILNDDVVRNRTFNAAYHTGAINFAAKCTEFSSLLYGEIDTDATPVNAPTDFESFLFFTDPHLTELSGWENKCYEFIAQIQKYYNSTPTTFCLCGGDWLGNSDLPSDACYKLGYIDGFMHSMFENCFMLVGNHDTNYQGKKDSESATFTTRLSWQSIADLWYRENKKTYYTFNGANTRFYCFDTGSESQLLTAENNYGYEQTQWFANALQTDNSPHIALAAHIVLPGNDATVYQPLTDLVMRIAQAYNNRGSITVNDVDYDYTSATGKVEFMIGGHKHADENGVLYGIPWVLTANVRKDESLGATFDLVFADYDNGVLKLIRVGYGENRTISLA